MIWWKSPLPFRMRVRRFSQSLSSSSVASGATIISYCDDITRIESVDGETGSRRTREDASVKAIELLLRARMPKLYGKKVEQTVIDGGDKKTYAIEANPENL